MAASALFLLCGGVVGGIQGPGVLSRGSELAGSDGCAWWRIAAGMGWTSQHSAQSINQSSDWWAPACITHFRHSCTAGSLELGGATSSGHIELHMGRPSRHRPSPIAIAVCVPSRLSSAERRFEAEEASGVREEEEAPVSNLKCGRFSFPFWGRNGAMAVDHPHVFFPISAGRDALYFGPWHTRKSRRRDQRPLPPTDDDTTSLVYVGSVSIFL